MSNTFVWKDRSVGSRKRAAHYLSTKVGKGKVFNILDLRAEIPDVAQIDRRVRELRKVGWVIHSCKDRSDLEPHEYHLHKIGKKIWEKNFKWPKSGISASKRRKVIERDGARCAICYIDFGSTYPDAPNVIARGTIGHILALERGGNNSLHNLQPECHLCNEPIRNLTATPADLGLLERELSAQSRPKKKKLLHWMEAEKRELDDIEQLWMRYRRLPAPQKKKVHQALKKQCKSK